MAGDKDKSILEAFAEAVLDAIKKQDEEALSVKDYIAKMILDDASGLGAGLAKFATTAPRVSAEEVATLVDAIRRARDNNDLAARLIPIAETIAKTIIKGALI